MPEASALPPGYHGLRVSSGVRSAATRTPGKVALTCGERSLTYSALVERINRVANGAAGGLGLQRGDRVALMAPNCLEFIELVCGLGDAGVAAAMVNPRATATELAFVCGDAGARVLFVHGSLTGVVEEAGLDVERVVVIGGDYDAWLQDASPAAPTVPVDEWDAFCISYTAGTTGTPKGAMLPHRSRALTFLGMAAEYGCYGSDDRSLAISPMFHGGGFAFALAPLAFGGSCDVVARFDPEALLRRLVEIRATNTFMVPTHFHAIFELSEATLAGIDMSHLRAIVANAAALPQTTKERIVERFGPGLLHESYGSTEAGIVLNLRPPDQLRKLQCVGQPFPHTEVRLLDPEGQEVAQGEIGELHSRSPYLFNGYWNRPEANASAFPGGWFSAGDLARRDEEGYHYIVDRKTDMILTGGVNVYPREVEEALFAHPGVAEAAVVGVPDPYWGETVTAFVVPVGEPPTLEELTAFCAGSLARYKLPKAVHVIPALPRNPAGKVLRRVLRDQAVAAGAAPAPPR